MQTTFLGDTGHVRFDADGERTDFDLEIYQTKRSAESPGLRKVGTWSTGTGLMWTREEEEEDPVGDHGGYFGAAGLSTYLRSRKKTLVLSTVLVSLDCSFQPKLDLCFYLVEPSLHDGEAGRARGQT